MSRHMSKPLAPRFGSRREGRITHLFTSLGTCGTVTGIGKFLRGENPKIKIVAVQPTEGHDVPGLRNVSQLGVSKLFDPALVDDILEVDFNLAYTRALELCQNEGLAGRPQFRSDSGRRPARWPPATSAASA